MKKLLSLLLVFLILSVSCISKPETVYKQKQGTKVQWYHTDVSKDIPEDKEIVDIIKPYKDQLSKEMNTVIGYAEVDLVKGSPESTLGNFVADVIFDTARHFDKDVDCAITNSGGLRAPIYKGKIKVKDAFNLMPFQNRIVILKFSGKDFLELIREIVENRGEPVSNLTINVTDGLIDAYVNGKQVEDYKTYKVATIDYLYKGGGSMPAMKKGELVKDTKVLLRDAIIEYIKKHKKINEKIEGRILLQ
ncbi:5'-nucleotidase [Thermotomaculum hydrothermale]|uniref:5'-nucleotidase n=1 Tax=Thermotomaculum hydrothermale TaxID=981385 RepID=A0A7R6PSJ3_9BACT|nr:5'-nucleotidase C-terminal domain-containing protein [Thermotomaculum hydrothermale]BBB31842.1 5'-nucleotidase [Thermotomaculum hydrothermale]